MSETSAPASVTEGLDDATLIRRGVTAAIQQSLLPAAVQKAYPGHFTIVADGHWFGQENTWPGLDSWQMAGAYLLLGRTQLVLDYFDFVQACQRADGHIPFAVFSADTPPEHLTTYLKGVSWPDGIFTYEPKREGYRARKWVGAFSHWIAGINPLSTLAPVSYLLLGEEIFAATGDKVWLEKKLGSLEATARHLLSRKSANGLIAGAGFYTEMPPRHQWDGVAQCYIVHAWRRLAGLCAVLGRTVDAARWRAEADTLAARFREVFWRVDHFAEYVHPDRGLVDLHGLTDVNWAAIAHEVATPAQAEVLWPRLMAEKDFWYGGMPTLTATKPFTYQEWEFFSAHEDVGFELPVGPLYDVAAMGRVWFLEAQACLRRGEQARLREAVVKICRAGLDNGGFWHERYHPLQSRKVGTTGPRGYCEYPSVLVRIVLGHPAVFGDLSDVAKGN